jgi:3-oxoadipate enol-lactonase
MSQAEWSNAEQGTAAAAPAGVARARDGAMIAFRLHGSGDPRSPRVVLIHSLALDGGMWDGLVSILAPDAQVLTIDCRGHGRSSRPRSPFTVEMFGDDIADVLDHVHWNSAVVVGCSMGGCVAQAFAGRHPGRVRALALIDTTAWYGPNAVTEWRERAEKARAQGLASLAGFQTTRWFGERFRNLHGASVRRTVDVFIANDLECYAAACNMLGNADLRPNLSKFDFPVAVIVGEEDYATPIQSARDLQQAIPGASLTILLAARHLTPIECPEAVAEEVRALIRRGTAPA